MSNLEIQIEENKTAFRPGEKICGNAKWNFDSVPSSLELSLFWRTEGRGIQDVGVIETVSFENFGASGQKEFKFTAPNGPYSCSGELISIVWALELAMTKGIIDKDAVRKEITISPTGQKIIICAEPISDSTKNVSKSVLGRLKNFFATTR